MNDAVSCAAIDRLVSAINAGNVAALDTVFTDDVVIEWPQSGERIRGVENRRAIYSRMPGLPAVTVQRVTGSGDMWVLEADLVYGGSDAYQCIFVFRTRGGQIAHEIGYWSKAFPAPEWRAPWVERM